MMEFPHARKVSAAVLAFLAYASVAFAQVLPQPGPPVPTACAFNTSPVTLTTGQAGWVQCDSSGRLIVSGGGGPVASYADKSGTITSGGTAQTIAAANTARLGFLIQNNSSGDLWFSTLATAIVGQPSIRILPNAMYESPVSGAPTGAISLIGATTGQAFSAREW